MKRLFTKPCNVCGTPIEGVKRADRNAYHYSPRCKDCSHKNFDPNLKKFRQDLLNKFRPKSEVGARQKHQSRDGLFYWRIKIAQPNVWEYEHRVITNAPKGFHVHHLNGNTLDNRQENLMIIAPSEHSKHHATILRWSRKYDCCQVCKTTIKKHLANGLCTTCYQRK